MAAWSVTGPGAYKASTVGLQTQFVAHTEAETLAAYGRVAQRDNEFFWSDVEVAAVDGGRVVAKGTVLYRIVVPKET